MNTLSDHHGCAPLALVLILAALLLAMRAEAQPDCPDGPSFATASLILPEPGPSLHPGDVITAESLSGECYGAVTQAQTRTALAIRYESPEDIHRPEIAVRIYRDGDVVRTLRTGLLPQPNDILNIAPSDSLWMALDSLRIVADGLADLYQQAAAEITTLRDSLATLHAGQDAAIAAAVAEAEARHRQELARARAEVQALTREMLEAMAAVWRVSGAVGAPAMQVE